MAVFVLVFAASFMIQTIVTLPSALDIAGEANPQFKKEYQELREMLFGKPNH